LIKRATSSIFAVVRNAGGYIETLIASVQQKFSKKLWALFAAYCVLLVALLPALPFWLDEILDLQMVRDLNFSQLIAAIPQNSGGVPLGYIAQSAAVHLLGFSKYSGRLPSAIFSAASVAGVYHLAKSYGRTAAILAAALIALFPLQLRYAVEARPYSQALALTIWATVVFFQFDAKPRWLVFTVYTVLIAAAIYTQPYSIFVPAAHAVWLMGGAKGQLQDGPTGRTAGPTRGALPWLCAAVVIAGLTFLPWYVFASHTWHESLREYSFSFRINSPLVVLKELVGAGYWGTAFVLPIAYYGFRCAKLLEPSPSLHLAGVVIPLVLAIAADAAIGYFLAIRQMIYVTPFLAVLCGIGAARLLETRSLWAYSLATALFLVMIGGDFHYFLKPHENWEQAARYLDHEISNGSHCLIVVPPGSIRFYSFFAPQLASNITPDYRSCNRLTVAISPYDMKSRESVAQLERAGYRLVSQTSFNGPRVFEYRAAEPSNRR
jgi:uncharacterized membrane protein